MVHTLRLDNYYPTPRKMVLGTNSSFGTESIKIERGAGWDGLNLTATWHIPGREEPLRVALLDGDAMDVPPEVTKEARDGVLVLAGLASGVQRASCNVEYLILEQAGIYGGADAEPTPELAAQVLEAALQAKADAEAAAEDAAAAKADTDKAQADAEKAQQAAENAAADAAKAGPYAEAARAAQEAAESARDEASAAQQAAENAAAAAAASKSAADTLAAEAARAAQAAENFKEAANNAAGIAGENATAAQQAAATAITAANDAGQSASDAAASKAAAETAEKAAQDAQTAAATAKEEAVKAQGAAQTAAKSAQDAQAAAEKVRDEAKAARDAAENSATAAKTSEDAAAKSAADADSTANSIKDSMGQIAENKEAVSQLKEDIGDIESATVITNSSKNLLNTNDADFLQNKILNATGAETENENNSTTGFIPCENGDDFIVGYTTSPSNPALTRVNPVFAYLYDKNKNFLLRSFQYPAVDYVYSVNNENAKYIRFALSNSFLNKEYIMLAKSSTNLPFEAYFAPYKVLKNQSDVEELKSDVEDVNKHIIDCWGDSRTEMIANDGTSYCDYLKALLGSEFHVQNYGESSQSSGMCAARFGSNELFMTFPDNRLNASGATNLSAIECTSGNDRNVYEYSKSRYVYGSLNGVYGKFERTSIATFDGVKFTRLSDGLEVPIKPRTKLVVDNVSQREHVNVFWWGKNDFASALAYIVSGIIDNYDKAIKWLGHKYFIILGETCSLTSSYEEGGSNRIKLDEINNTLKKKYPNNFIDINEYLSSEQALTDVGLTITDADSENISKGFPCEQLMVHITNQSDTVHPNEKGREAIAHKIYEFMQNKGWITS